MSFLTVLKTDFRNIFSDPDIILTIIVGVIFYSFFYPMPYLNQSVSEFDVAIVDRDKSDLTRKMSFMLDATAQIHVVDTHLSEAEAKAALLSGDIKGFIVFPKNFKHDLYLQKQPNAAIGADATYFLIYGAIAEAAVETILTESAEIEVVKMLIEEEGIYNAMKHYSPFGAEVINLFNPENSYIVYVLPAVFLVILQQTLLIGMGILGGGINERYSSYRFLDDVPVWMAMLSKTVIFGSIYFVYFLYYYGFSFEYYEIPHIGNISDLLALAVPFLLSTIMLGTLLGSLFNSREVATPVLLGTSLPIVFSAGFIWPLEALPQWIIWLSQFNPSTPAIQGFLKLNQMGADFDQVIGHFAHMWILTIVYGVSAYAVLHRNQKKLQGVREQTNE